MIFQGGRYSILNTYTFSLHILYSFYYLHVVLCTKFSLGGGGVYINPQNLKLIALIGFGTVFFYESLRTVSYIVYCTE